MDNDIANIFPDNLNVLLSKVAMHRLYMGEKAVECVTDEIS